MTVIPFLSNPVRLCQGRRVVGRLLPPVTIGPLQSTEGLTFSSPAVKMPGKHEELIRLHDEGIDSNAPLAVGQDLGQVCCHHRVSLGHQQAAGICLKSVSGYHPGVNLDQLLLLWLQHGETADGSGASGVGGAL